MASFQRLDGILCLLTLLTVSGLLIQACEQSFDPFEDEPDQFSIYGAISAGDDPDYIRVRDMNAPFTRQSTETLEADVYFEDLQEGTTYELDRERLEFDEIYAHNFRVESPRKHEHSYRVRVERRDGDGEVESTVELPEYSEPWTFTPVDRCDVAVTFHFRNLDRASKMKEMRFGANLHGDPRFFRVFPGNLQQVDEDEGEYAVTFTPRNILATLFPNEEPECHELASDHIYVEYRRVGDRFLQRESPAFDPFEAEFVKDGLGFLGGYYEHSFQVPINTDELPFCEDIFDPAQCQCPPEVYQDECEPTTHEFDIDD